MKEIKIAGNLIKQNIEPNRGFFNTNEVIDSWKGNCFIVQESINNGIKKNGLRTPQVGAIYSALGHWACSSELATIVMPTGTGKT